MISIDKKYRTRSGKPVRVLCTDRIVDYYPVLCLVGKNQSVETYTALGFFNHNGEESSYDLIEISPYEDFKKDDPVMVTECNLQGPWQKRYFSHIDERGAPWCFLSGRGSWTAEGKDSTVQWSFCRRPTAEELGETR